MHKIRLGLLLILKSFVNYYLSINKDCSKKIDSAEFIKRLQLSQIMLFHSGTKSFRFSKILK